MNTKVKGARAEGAVMAALLKLNKKVLLPFGENSRYDLVFDDDGCFIRVQCKSGRLVGSEIHFNSCSAGVSGRKDYRGQIEYFGIYCAELGKVYLVPVDRANKTDTVLRLVPSATRNAVLRARSLSASDFEL